MIIHYKINVQKKCWGKSTTINFFFLVSTGFDKESWGLSYKGTAWHGGQKVQYCEPFFDKTTVIGCHLNLYKGTLAFSVNGTYMGVAFTGVNSVSGPLYPIVSSTASETELGLGEQYCRYLTLQEKCLQTIKRHLEYDDSVDCLPLPKVFKSSIKNIWTRVLIVFNLLFVLILNCWLICD